MDDVRALLGVELPKMRLRTVYLNTGTVVTYRVGHGKRVNRMMKGATDEEKFVARMDKRPCGYETDCWVWTGYRDKDGYGRFFAEGKTRGAHRWAYEHWVRPLADDEVPDHLCSIRACVNPDHLEAVPHGENSRRGRKRLVANRTHCVNGHEYTDETMYLAPKGTLVCRTCTNESSRKWKEANKPVPKPVEPKPVRTHCIHGHELAVVGVYEVPNKETPRCRACDKDRKAKHKAKAAKQPKPPRTHCRRGHELAAVGEHINPTTGYGSCMECSAINERARQERNRRSK